jgi:hypothetical protein
MTQNAQPANPWDSVESVETNIVKFEAIGKTLVGLLLSRKDTNTKFGESPFYKILTPEGETGFFASALLDDKLTNQIGNLVQIKFTETKPSNKGNDAKIFVVKALPDTPENRIMVGLNEESNW